MNEEIKIYRDFYDDPNYVLVGYKGKNVSREGIIYIPYHKPNILVRAFGAIRHRIKSIFGKKPEVDLLFGREDGRENIWRGTKPPLKLPS